MNFQELRKLYADTAHMVPDQFDADEWLETKSLLGDELATRVAPRRMTLDRPGLIASKRKCDLVGWYATSSHAISRGLLLVREVQDVGGQDLDIDATVTFKGSDGVVHDGFDAIAGYFDVSLRLATKLFDYRPGASLAQARMHFKKFLDREMELETITANGHKPMELTELKDYADEDVVEHILNARGIELQFNGRLLWGDVVGAIVAARRELASGTSLTEDEIVPNRLRVAVYHPFERAIYVAIDFRMPDSRLRAVAPIEGAEQVVRKRGGLGQVELNSVSIGTSAKVLESGDAIDLTKIIWLPYSDWAPGA